MNLVTIKIDEMKNNIEVYYYEIFDLIDATNKIAIIYNSGKDMSEIKSGLDQLVFLILENETLSSYSNSSVLYLGETFSIQIASNSINSINEAREKNLPIINLAECESKIEKLGLITGNLYSINMNFDYYLNTGNETSNSGIKSSSDTFFPTVIDSNFNAVDTSICTDLEILFPVNQENIEYQDYLEILQKYNVDIYNKSSDFFNDICFSYTSDNNTDVTLSLRRDKFNLSSACSSDCSYEGIDEHGYAKCICNKIPKTASQYFEEAIYDSLLDNNIFLITCYKQALDKNTILNNVGFWTLAISTLIVIIILIILKFTYKYGALKNHFEEVLYMDSEIGINPSKVGQIKSESNNHIVSTNLFIKCYNKPLKSSEYELKQQEELQYITKNSNVNDLYKNSSNYKYLNSKSISTNENLVTIQSQSNLFPMSTFNTIDNSVDDIKEECNFENNYGNLDTSIVTSNIKNKSVNKAKESNSFPKCSPHQCIPVSKLSNLNFKENNGNCNDSDNNKIMLKENQDDITLEQRYNSNLARNTLTTNYYNNVLQTNFSIIDEELEAETDRYKSKNVPSEIEGKYNNNFKSNNKKYCKYIDNKVDDNEEIVSDKLAINNLIKGRDNNNESKKNKKTEPYNSKENVINKDIIANKNYYNDLLEIESNYLKINATKATDYPLIVGGKNNSDNEEVSKIMDINNEKDDEKKYNQNRFYININDNFNIEKTEMTQVDTPITKPSTQLKFYSEKTNSNSILSSNNNILKVNNYFSNLDRSFTHKLSKRGRSIVNQNKLIKLSKNQNNESNTERNFIDVINVYNIISKAPSLSKNMSNTNANDNNIKSNNRSKKLSNKEYLDKYKDLKIDDIKTHKDFNNLPICVQVEIDNRSICQILVNSIKLEHRILNLFFLKSVINPLWIRLTSVLFEYSMDFALNAIYFSSDIINSQYEAKVTEGQEAVGLWYILSNEFWKSFWPVVISLIISLIINLIISIPPKYMRELNEAFKTKDRITILVS